MRTVQRVATALLFVGVFAACEDQLVVGNPNQPDRDRVLATPADAEAFLGGTYKTIHSGTLGGATVPGGLANDNMQSQLLVSGMESFSLNANYGMATRMAIPRNPIDNTRGNNIASGNFRDWNLMHRAGRSALLVLNRLYQPGFTFGTVNQDIRGRAWAYFTYGVAVGNLALAYDSVAMMRVDDDPQVISPLIYYDSAMKVALWALDSAEVITNANAAAFPLPAEWLNIASGSFTNSGADFARLIRSYRARFRANVSRSTQERNEVDWERVVTDATTGIQTDYLVALQPSQGWDVVWPIQHYLFQNWHQMWQFYVGMADTTGTYDAWLATPLGNRTSFLVRTPDKRFPSGDTRDQQVANSPANPPAGRYFRNRSPGDDAVGALSLGNSMYDHYRFREIYLNSRIGPWPVMTKAEMDMLAAEGYIRTNRIPQAIPLIDTYRVKSGLPALAGNVTSIDDPVPGGPLGCVPRVPAGPNFSSARCGNIMEAMKWEYRMETAFTGYGMWYFAGRGWGDLPEGTPLHWPVPYQEMDTRRQEAYQLGGVGGPSAAPRSNYGI